MGLNVMIVGGGLAGLAAAAFLRKQHKVTILERGDLDFARNDYGISVLCNAYRLLFEAGLQEESLDCVPMIHLWSRNAQNESVQDFEFDTRKIFGAPTVLTRRSRLQAELYRLATSTDLAGEPAKVVQGVKINSVDAEKGFVRDSTGREFSGDLIIGADGINSVVRAAVLSRDDSDENSGEAPAATHDLLAFVATLPLSHVQARQDFAWFSDPEDNAGLVRWKGNAGEKRGLLGYHINPREFQLYGYTTEDEFAAQFDDQNTTIIKGVPCSRAQSAFPDFTPALTDLFAHSNSGDGTVEAWRIRDIDPISQWTKGRTLLIGDAAHAITPHIGQGCNMAFEDAEALGYLLRDAKTVEDAQAAFPSFLKIRQTRAHEVAFSSRHHGNILKPEQAKEAGQFDLDGFRKRVYTYRGAEAELNAIKAA